MNELNPIWTSFCSSIRLNPASHLRHSQVRQSEFGLIFRDECISKTQLTMRFSQVLFTEVSSNLARLPEVFRGAVYASPHETRLDKPRTGQDSQEVSL